MTDMHGLKPNVWPNTPYNVTAQIRGDIREIVQREIEQITIGMIGAETPAGAQAKVDAAALTLTAAIAAAKAELALVDDTKAALIHTHDDRYYLKSQVDAALSGKAPLVHDHALLYYTQAQVDAALAGKAGVVHGHNDLYYTEAEVDSALAGKSDAGHTHPGVYYTVAQADGLLATKAPLSHNHNTLYYSISQIDTALAGKAAAVHSHNDLYYTEAEVDALIAGVSSNAGWTPVNATTTTKGIVELATTTETTTGTDTTRAVTPAGVKAALDAKTVSDTSTYVPLTRTVNGQPLSADIVVSGGGFPLQNVTVESDMTVSKTTWPTDQIVTVVLVQDASGSHTVTHGGALASGVVWSPGQLPGSETVTTWRYSSTLALWVVEGCWISVAGSAPADVTPPTAGTLSSSAITGSSFTLTVTGATDAGGLHAQPYRFSTDNGASWSAWQTLEHYNATGLDDSTEYTCVHQVRDAALNTTTGASIAVTTATPDPGNEPPEWTATFTMGTPTSTNVTATASAMATDDTAVAGYEVSYNGGSSWASITPAGSVFTLTGTAETTYSTTQLRAVDGDGAYSTALAVSSYTLAAETAAVTATYRGRINGASGADFAIGDAPTGGATRSVIVAYVALYDGAAPTGMTIGGVSATRDAYYDGSGTWQTQQPVAMFHAAVPTGTTATITATGGGGTGPKMYVWTTDAAVTCIEAEVSDGSTGTETVALATASGGVAVAAAAGQFGINEAYGWAAGMDTDEYVANYAAAHGATTGASKTVTWSGYRNRMVAAAYGAV